MKILLILCAIIMLTSSQQTQFEIFRRQMQNKVKWISQNLTTLFQDACSNEQVTNCERKTFNLCNGTGQRSCLQKFPTPQICVPQGIWFGIQSGIRFPNSVILDNLTQKEKQFVCVSTMIEPTMVNIFNQNQNRYTYTYVGSSTGGIRVHPAFMDDQIDGSCIDYDPRTRPWYASAVSGGKNMIMFLDISGTMKGTRFYQARKATQATLKTMGTHDDISIITFSSTPRVLGNFTKLMTASQTTKDDLQKQLELVVATDEQTNYIEAIRKGFEIIKNTLATVEKICHTDFIFMFMTDGVSSQQSQTEEISNLKGLIDSNLAELNINLTFIAFALGEEKNLNYTLLQTLACRYGGFLQKIQNVSQNVVQKVQNYYDFLVQSTMNVQPFWTQPYYDLFELGWIVTASIPIFSKQLDGNGIAKIFGVAGLDVLVSKLAQFQYSESEVQTLLSRQRTCYSRAHLSPCQLQAARKRIQSDLDCGYNCSIIEQTSCNYTAKHIFKAAEDTTIDTDRCCKINKVELGFIVSFAILFIIVTLSVFYLKKKEKLCFRNKTSVQMPSASSRNLNADDVLLETSEGKVDRYQLARKFGVTMYDEPPLNYDDGQW